MTADGALLDPDMSHTSTRRPSRATPSRKATHSSKGTSWGSGRDSKEEAEAPEASRGAAATALTVCVVNWVLCST